MNRSEYHEHWKKRNADKVFGSDSMKNVEVNGNSKSRKFKIALATMTSPEYFASLQEQFNLLKDQAGNQKATIIGLH